MGARSRLALRRPVRDSIGRGGGGGVTTPPLPSTAIAAWHSELQCAPTAWVDYIGGRSMVGTGAPVVAPDPGFFSGRQVAQAAQSGKSWSGTFAAIALTGTRPWVYCVGRSRTLDATSRNLIVASGGGVETGLVRQRTTNASAAWNAVASVFSVGAGNTIAHAFSTWLDGTNLSLKVDGTSVVNAYAAAILTDITAVTVGTSPLAGGREHDVSVAYLLFCSAKPTAAEERALDAWASVYYALPTPPLDALTVAYWDANQAGSVAFGVAPNVNTWTDSLGGKVTAKPAAAFPQYPIVEAQFAGSPVLQTIRTGPATLTGLGNNIVAAGTRPYMISLARLTTLPIAGQTGAVFALARQATEGGAATGQMHGARDPSVASVWVGIFVNASINVPSVAAQDLLPHVFETWLDGVNANFRVDGVLSQVASAATINVGNTTAIGSYGADNNTNHHTSANHAFHMICSAKPSEAYIASLRAWLSATKGAP